jgi:hypothetical protein
MSVTRHARHPAHHGRQLSTPARSARIGSWTWADPVVRGWVFVALIPVFALLAYGAAAGVFTLLGYQVGVTDAPVWVDRLSGLAAFVTLALPCFLAVRSGNEARVGADRRGLAPLAIGLLVGAWWTATAAFALAGTF